MLFSIADNPELRWENLSEGLASGRSGAGVGERGLRDTDGCPNHCHGKGFDGRCRWPTAQVVGLVDLSGSAQRLGGSRFHHRRAGERVGRGRRQTRVPCRGDGSRSQQQLVDSIASALPADSTVLTGEEAAPTTRQRNTWVAPRSSARCLLAFGAICRCCCRAGDRRYVCCSARRAHSGTRVAAMRRRHSQKVRRTSQRSRCGRRDRLGDPRRTRCRTCLGDRSRSNGRRCAGASFVTERHPGDRAGRSCRRHRDDDARCICARAGGNEALPAGGTAADGVQARAFRCRSCAGFWAS